MGRLNINLDEETHRRLKVRCAETGTEMSEVLRKLIQEYLEKTAPKKKRKK